MVSKILYENEAGQSAQPTAQEPIKGLQGIEQLFQKCGINLSDTSNPTAGIIKEWLSANCDMPQMPDIGELEDATDPDIKGTLDMLNTADKATLAKVLKEIESGNVSPETFNTIKAQFDAALKTVDTSQ